ncbi:hypothetical protein BT246_70570 (plasmid) [Bacillus thuringiensis]|uniref:Uncharacterized protein n=1 Tax=Bacillus thuringiensis TaxID=1428 RepID=A0A9W3SJJ5_BACTU|nr:hypothetical protein [Bacillus thuringiensis]ANS52348.1 hypothetical protein BT246_70570 [Bacillus thuringiensis]
MVLLKDFQTFQNSSASPTLISTISTNSASPTVIGTITFDTLHIGDRVELDGIFHVNNNNSNATGTQFITLEIKRRSTLIYQSTIEIDDEVVDDFTFISFKHVDVLPTSFKNGNYQVTVFANVRNMELYSPINVTGKRYDVFA